MRDTIDEQWRPIEGYEGLYEVSTLGRVKRVKGYDSLGHLRNEKILSPVMNEFGYLRVHLCKEGKQKSFLVHRLVGQAFIPNPEGLGEINHKDEDKTNNVVFLNDDGSVDVCRSNLEWCDRDYNINYGTCRERATKNSLQTKINNGTYDPEMCGMTRKEYNRLYYQKNKDRFRERRIEYMREYYRQKKQEKKKDNHPSEVSLW